MTALSRRRLVGVALAVATASTAVVLAVAAQADPPWQAGASKIHDPNAVGTLAFYDAAGTQIYSGSTTAAPFAAYVAGSQPLRAGDTHATLFAYLPDKDTNAAGWTGSILNAASAYPNAGAPGALASAGPLETGTASDVSLAQFISGHPNTGTGAYANIYELRLRTSADGKSGTDAYDVADVQVTGSTWQIVYPQHFLTSTTTLTVTPTKGVHVGASITLAATVGPAAATGSVKFTDGTKSLGTVALSSGAASKSVKVSTAGSHTFHATYVPTSGSTYGTSTAAKTIKVAKAVSHTTDVLSPKSVRKTKHATLKVTVTATGVTPTGTVAVLDGSKKVASGKLKSGKVTIVLPKLAVGKHKLVATYGGSTKVSSSSAGAVTLTVTK